jgi:hypothetical protein
VAGQLGDVALDVDVGGLQSMLARGVKRLKESRLLRGRRCTEILTSLIWGIDELIEPALAARRRAWRIVLMVHGGPHLPNLGGLGYLGPGRGTGWRTAGHGGCGGLLLPRWPYT